MYCYVKPYRGAVRCGDCPGADVVGSKGALTSGLSGDGYDLISSVAASGQSSGCDKVIIIGIGRGENYGYVRRC